MAFPKKKAKEGSKAEEKKESPRKEKQEQAAGEIPDATEDPIGHAKHHLAAQEGDGHGVRVNVGAGSTVHVHAPVSPGESQIAPNPAPAQGVQAPIATGQSPYNPVQDHYDKLKKSPKHGKKGSASNPKGAGAAGGGI